MSALLLHVAQKVTERAHLLMMRFLSRALFTESETRKLHEKSKRSVGQSFFSSDDSSFCSAAIADDDLPRCFVHLPDQQAGIPLTLSCKTVADAQKVRSCSNWHVRAKQICSTTVSSKCARLILHQRGQELASSPLFRASSLVIAGHEPTQFKNHLRDQKCLVSLDRGRVNEQKTLGSCPLDHV